MVPACLERHADGADRVTTAFPCRHAGAQAPPSSCRSTPRQTSLRLLQAAAVASHERHSMISCDERPVLMPIRLSTPGVDWIARRQRVPVLCVPCKIQSSTASAPLRRFLLRDLTWVNTDAKIPCSFGFPSTATPEGGSDRRLRHGPDDHVGTGGSRSNPPGTIVPGSLARGVARVRSCRTACRPRPPLPPPLILANMDTNAVPQSGAAPQLQQLRPLLLAEPETQGSICPPPPLMGAGTLPQWDDLPRAAGTLDGFH